MRGKQHKNVALLRYVAGQSVPPATPSKWNAREPSQIENFSQFEVQSVRDILHIVVVVDFVWAAALCEYGVVGVHSHVLEDVGDLRVYFLARYSRRKVLFDGIKLLELRGEGASSQRE